MKCCFTVLKRLSRRTEAQTTTHPASGLFGGSSIHTLVQKARKSFDVPVLAHSPHWLPVTHRTQRWQNSSRVCRLSSESLLFAVCRVTVDDRPARYPYSPKKETKSLLPPHTTPRPFSMGSTPSLFPQSLWLIAHGLSTAANAPSSQLHHPLPTLQHNDTHYSYNPLNSSESPLSSSVSIPPLHARYRGAGGLV